MEHAGHIRYLSSTEEAGAHPPCGRGGAFMQRSSQLDGKRPGRTPALHSRTTASLAGHIVPDDHVAVGEHIVGARRHGRAAVDRVHPAGGSAVLFFGKPADRGNVRSVRGAACVDGKAKGAQRIIGRGAGIERVRPAGGNRIADGAAGNRHRYGDDVRRRRLLTSGAGRLRPGIARRRRGRLGAAACGGAGICSAAVAVSG